MSCDMIPVGSSHSGPGVYPSGNGLLAQAEDFVVTFPNRNKATLIDLDTEHNGHHSHSVNVC